MKLDLRCVMDKYIAGKICKIDDMDEFLGIIAAFYWGFAMDLMREFLGFGVAGNFANHLEQAGEADDFADIISDEKDEPKGIFHFISQEARRIWDAFVFVMMRLSCLKIKS